jgi:hypothetical protein
MSQSVKYNIREVILTEVQAQISNIPRIPMQEILQRDSVLRAVRKKLPGSIPDQAILTEWSDLFRTGLFAWGSDLLNPDPPRFHVTDRGQQALAHMARDPANPAAYLRHLQSIAKLPDVAASYLQEGLDCYVDGRFKASAVMVGCAAESIILSLRDSTVLRLHALGKPVAKQIEDWRIKVISESLYDFFHGHAKSFSRELKEPFDAYWSAFAQQIRAVRNDVGHPSSIDPVTPDTVHASLLVFPELARLATALTKWVSNSLN